MATTSIIPFTLGQAILGQATEPEPEPGPHPPVFDQPREWATPRVILQSLPSG